MAKATAVSTISSPRFHNVSDMLGQAAAMLRGTKPDPKAWRVTRAGDVILPNRRIELRTKSIPERTAVLA